MMGMWDSHVMMLTQVREVLVQFLHPLLVRLDAFSFQPFVQLHKPIEPVVSLPTVY
jgi:hypothetical protein